MIRRKWQQWRAYKASLKHRSRVLYGGVDFVETIVIALGFALLIREYIMMVSLVPSGSMIPTFQIRDRLFVNRFIYRFSSPKRGDIVVFESVTDDKDYVKRCIGLPGETIELKNGYVYINGVLLVLAGVDIQRDYTDYGPVTVPENQYFVLGDNRANSRDSRYWGFVPNDNLMGKSLFTFWPISQMRVLR
jgi:signal peptidase I|tara:strand:- start:293 stop:862 length:570 start_codon:yes stop_codon:yes gene_type:complete